MSGCKVVWNACKTEGEPAFEIGMFNENSNQYTLINEDEILKTDLKYALSCVEEINKHYYIWTQTISYLCYFAKHPNIEYLMKTGFSYLVNAKLEGNLHGVRINYRSNDVKIMLNLNKEEMQLLANCNTAKFMSEYLFFRREIKAQPNVLFEYTKQWGYRIADFIEIKAKTGLTMQKIINYADNKYRNVRDWVDYLRECEKLNYKLSDHKGRY